MSVSIRDCRYSKQDQRWIQDVYGEYMEALSDLNTGLFPVLGSGMTHADEIFANWFANDQSHPLIVLKGPEPVGFALVTRRRATAGTDHGVDYRMSEFFIRHQCRRVGIGRSAATLIFDRFAGEWEILEYLRNPGAVAFWRSVLATYSRGRYTERSRHGEVCHRFSSGPSVAHRNK